MDILNFISWIASKRRIVNTLNNSDLIPVGVRNETRDDKYTTVAISTGNFIAQIGPGLVGPAGPAGSQGPTGPQGVPGPVGPAGLTWQGIWSSATSYALNDAVFFGGASYFCYNPAGVGPSVSDPSVDTANWALLASQGVIGPQGPQGIQGIQGPGSPSFVITGLFSTTSLTNVLLTSILIPANTYSTTDAFAVTVQFTKAVGSVGSVLLMVNTVNSISGATTLGITNSTNSSNQYFALQRTCFIDNTLTYLFPNSTNNNSDLGSNTLTPSGVTIDWTQNQYIIVAGRVDNASFALTCRGIRIY